jgi:hypothetical protein
MVYYDPAGPRSLLPDTPANQSAPWTSAGPDAAEAAASRREMQRQVWGADEAISLSERTCTAPSSARARRWWRAPMASLAGFLFGFYALRRVSAFAGRLGAALQWRRIPPRVADAGRAARNYRGLRIANLLKKFDRRSCAFARGHSASSPGPADPLQAPNAALNFGLLRAVVLRVSRPTCMRSATKLNRVTRLSRFSPDLAGGQPSVCGIRR